MLTTDELRAKSIAARLEQGRTSRALDEALARLLSSERSAEQAAGGLRATETFKAAANARLAFYKAIGDHEQAMRLRYEAEMLECLGALGHTTPDKRTPLLMEDHVRRWRTGAPRTTQVQLIKASLALASEAGEVAGAVEKWAYRGEELDHNKLLDELGDVYYNLTDLVLALGFTLQHVALANQAKWQRRYPDGPPRTSHPQNINALAAFWARLTGA